jgi:hypothetical protein
LPPFPIDQYGMLPRSTRDRSAPTTRAAELRKSAVANRSPQARSRNHSEPRVTPHPRGGVSGGCGIGEQTPRLLYYCRVNVRILPDTVGMGVLTIRGAQSGRAYKEELLRRCSARRIRMTWKYFTTKSRSAGTQSRSAIKTVGLWSQTVASSSRRKVRRVDPPHPCERD